MPFEQRKVDMLLNKKWLICHLNKKKNLDKFFSNYVSVRYGQEDSVDMLHKLSRWLNRICTCFLK